MDHEHFKLINQVFVFVADRIISNARIHKHVASTTVCVHRQQQNAGHNRKEHEVANIQMITPEQTYPRTQIHKSRWAIVWFLQQGAWLKNFVAQKFLHALEFKALYQYLTACFSQRSGAVNIMNYLYMSTCMKALCRHVRQNK